MKEIFDEIVNMIRKSAEKCPWLTKQTLESYKQELLDETQEAAEAIDKKDYQNLKEELGDVVWDALVIAVLAEKEGHFKTEEILTTIRDKMKRRKPYLFVEEKDVTIEEAKKIWRDVKEQEKNGEI